jgi:hypothetical protein
VPSKAPIGLRILLAVFLLLVLLSLGTCAVTFQGWKQEMEGLQILSLFGGIGAFIGFSLVFQKLYPAKPLAVVLDPEPGDDRPPAPETRPVQQVGGAVPSLSEQLDRLAWFEASGAVVLAVLVVGVVMIPQVFSVWVRFAGSINGIAFMGMGWIGQVQFARRHDHSSLLKRQIRKVGALIWGIFGILGLLATSQQDLPDGIRLGSLVAGLFAVVVVGRMIIGAPVPADPAEASEVAESAAFSRMVYHGLGWAAIVLLASAGYNIVAGGSAASRLPTVISITGVAFAVGSLWGLVSARRPE